ncbi:unnamed protein product [Sympodiomycopsis kandeliae]
MSTRDRFLSSLSSVQDQVRSAVDDHWSQLQQQYHNQQQQHPHQQQIRPQAQQSGSYHHPQPSSSNLNRQPTLPVYASRPNPHAPTVPDSVLAAPPGRAQEAYDSMPRSRLENPNVSPQERRKAAEEMRRNQEMLHRSTAFDQGQHVHRQQLNNQPVPLTPQQQRERALGLKRVHSYASGNGKVILDLFTLPQKSPTFMGGSASRGRGAMTGQVIVISSEGDRVGAIRLKVKAVARTSLPRSHYPPGIDPNARSAGPVPSNQPVNLVARSPNTEPTQAKEHLLLQLEKTLWTPGSRNQDTMLQSNDSRDDPTTWKAGRHVFDFKMDLPAAAKDGAEMPPSFVFLADSQASPAALKHAQMSGAVLNAKKWMTDVSQGGSGASGEWASIKWYVKVTVEKPGLFRANDRVFAPFVYLPPPPNKLNEHLIPRRLKLSQELRQDPQRPAQSLAEPASEWQETELDLTGQTHQASQKNGKKKADPSGGSGSMWSKIFKGPLVSNGSDASGKTRWSIAVPNRPAIWPLRATIPFELKVSGQIPAGPGARPTPPAVGLYLRVTLNHGNRSLTTGKNAPLSATETRLISTARLFIDGTSRIPSMGANTHKWRGVLDLPPQATPCFDSSTIQAEYFIAVQTMPQRPAANGPGAASVRPVGRIAWAQKVVLVCPLPAVIRSPPSAGVQSANRNGNGMPRRGGRSSGGSSASIRTATVPDRERDRERDRNGLAGSNAGTIKASAVQRQSDASRPSLPSRPSATENKASKASSSAMAIATGSNTRTTPPKPAAGPRMDPSARPPSSRRGSAASSTHAASSSNGGHSGRARSRRGSPPPGASGSDVSAAPSVTSSTSSHHGRRTSNTSTGTGMVASSTRPSPPSESRSSYPPEKVPLATIPSGQPSTSSDLRTTTAPPPPPPVVEERTTTPTPTNSRRSSSVGYHNNEDMDIGIDELENLGIGEGDMDMGMDLPPSYFEATREIEDD